MQPKKKLYGIAARIEYAVNNDLILSVQFASLLNLECQSD